MIDKAKEKATHQRWCDNNRERMREINRQSYRRHKADRLARVKKYREDNPEKVKECMMRWSKDNAEAIREWHRAHYAANKERINARNKEYRGKNKAAIRAGKLRSVYGLAPGQYESMLAEQGGVCAICKGSDPKGQRGSTHFRVDHDHATGRVRALLCGTCNTGIGMLGDSLSILRAAADYIELHAAAKLSIA